MSKIAESFNKVCELVQQKNQVGFGFTSPQAKELETALDSFEEGIVNAGVIPADWAHKSSIGKGNLASVMWVVFLPPGQTTQDGIYISLCFGRTGNGLVTGCAISNTSKRKYGYVPTVERKNPVIDVDGTRQGTHYNNGFVNPLEVGYNTLEEGGFLAHLQKSVEVCNQCLSMKGGPGMSESAKERHELWQKFLEKWPASKIEGMSLDDYTSFGGDRQSFSNWLEVHTDALGSIWGGSAYKFGVFKANPSSKVVSDSTHDGDGTYKWYKRYGRTAAEALEYVKQTFAHIAMSVASNDLSAIDKVDFGHAVTWKIAFLYQSEENPIIVPIYNKKMLCALTGMPNDTPTSVLQQKLIANKPFDQDLFDYYDDLLERLPVDEENEGGDLIKNEAMSKNQITAKPNDLKTDGAEKLSDQLAGGPDSLMTMLTAALLAKPFAILAGASGTGKSRMVKKLAYMTCNADQLRSEKDETPGNYCMVAVKPNWHDSSELLGYRSAISESHEYVTPDFIKFILRAHAFPKTPFFVCLDEMNLAPVEQYFAEFLSACESIRKNKEGDWVSDPLIQPGEFDKNVANLAPDYSLPDACIKRINERGLYIPHNLFVVGTVNMDDTTHQFSRKVLDRAMTLMMDDVDFGTLQDAQYEKLTNDLLMNGDDIKKFIDRGEFEGKDLEKDFKELLGKLQTALKESPFAIGYRFAIESVLYRKALALLGIEVAALDATAADHMALMKILPRITGTLEERDAVLKNLADFFGALGEHKQSGDRLEKMKTAARQNGDYISFWP